jgi:hypothetical protein
MGEDGVEKSMRVVRAENLHVPYLLLFQKKHVGGAQMEHTCESRSVDEIKQRLNPAPMNVKQKLKRLLDGISIQTPVVGVRILKGMAYWSFLERFERTLVPRVTNQLLFPLITLVKQMGGSSIVRNERLVQVVCW